MTNLSLVDKVIRVWSFIGSVEKKCDSILNFCWECWILCIDTVEKYDNILIKVLRDLDFVIWHLLIDKSYLL